MSRITILLVLFIAFSSCCHRATYTQTEYTAPSRNSNVCGHLKDEVVLFCVFANVGAYHPFTAYDVESTMDSVNKATDWIECQAELNNIPLRITPVLQETNRKWTFNDNIYHPYKKPGQKRKYAQYMNVWADITAKYTGRSIKQRRDAKIGGKTRITDLESMVRALRNKYETDNVAVMFFVNGYYEHEMCMAFNIYENGPEMEYAVMTHKGPGAIAHEFLHLFGGIDLYPHVKHPDFNYEEIEEKYPNEIMRITHKDLSKLDISPITKYYLGWASNMPKQDLRLLYHKANVLDY